MPSLNEGRAIGPPTLIDIAWLTQRFPTDTRPFGSSSVTWSVSKMESLWTVLKATDASCYQVPNPCGKQQHTPHGKQSFMHAAFCKPAD